ncbi:MAG: pilus assembly protein TadG-related protein [Hyphomonadaceae bacterium]
MGRKTGRRSRHGNVAVITGLIAVPLAMVIAMTVEMLSLTNERARMQAAVDAAALAGAREFVIAGRDARSAKGFAEAFALNQVADLLPRVTMNFTANQNADGGFQVSGVGVRGSFFGNLVPPGGFTIRVSAVGEPLNRQPLCVLTLPLAPPRKEVSLTARSNSSIQASNCLVHSNSTLLTSENAVIEAGTIQTTGTADGTGFSPAANTGAIGVSDPFAGRVMKRDCAGRWVGTSPLHYKGNSVASLASGTLARELIVSGNATLTLGPGDHYFCGGVRVEGNATLKGDNVVMILEGAKGFIASESSTLSFTGRQTEDWAGFLLITDRANRSDILISSKSVDKLLGTIYLPNSKLIINSAGQVAQDSKWSVVVAQDLLLDKNATLVINTDYAGSAVPVPGGVGNKFANSKTGTRLRQ